MKHGYIRILLGAETIISIPVSWRTKHYSDEDNERLAEELADRLGDILLSIDEDEEP